MRIHTGEPTVTGGGYVGLDVHKVARIMSAGQGGQVLVSEATRQLLAADGDLQDLGEHRLRT
jgi:class 3 adenylate cyclase